MILDSSVLVALVLEEPTHKAILEALVEERALGAGCPTLAETGLVLSSRLGVAARTHLSRLVDEFEIEELPFDDEHWPIATDAFLRFGRGRHLAALNFGDCLTYAVARLAAEPLLCLGDDFPRTDLEVVVPGR